MVHFIARCPPIIPWISGKPIFQIDADGVQLVPGKLVEILEHLGLKVFRLEQTSVLLNVGVKGVLPQPGAEGVPVVVLLAARNEHLEICAVQDTLLRVQRLYIDIPALVSRHRVDRVEGHLIGVLASGVGLAGELVVYHKYRLEANSKFSCGPKQRRHLQKEIFHQVVAGAHLGNIPEGLAGDSGAEVPHLHKDAVYAVLLGDAGSLHLLLGEEVLLKPGFRRDAQGDLNGIAFRAEDLYLVNVAVVLLPIPRAAALVVVPALEFGGVNGVLQQLPQKREGVGVQVGALQKGESFLLGDVEPAGDQLLGDAPQELSSQASLLKSLVAAFRLK